MRTTFLLFTVAVLSCSPQVDLPNLDQEAFASDVNGCRSIRASMIENLKKDKNLLKGLNQEQVTEVLGKPDQNELYKRNQKFFIYHLTPTNCSHQIVTTTHQYLSIRFNATGLAKEVVIYED